MHLRAKQSTTTELACKRGRGTHSHVLTHVLGTVAAVDNVIASFSKAGLRSHETKSGKKLDIGFWFFIRELRQVVADFHFPGIPGVVFVSITNRDREHGVESLRRRGTFFLLQARLHTLELWPLKTSYSRLRSKPTNFCSALPLALSHFHSDDGLHCFSAISTNI